MLNGLSTALGEISRPVPAGQRRGDFIARYWLGRMRLALDYMERLRRLAINDARFVELCGAEVDPRGLDSKTLELVRLAALISVGGAVPSYGAQADAAVSAGATAAEIVDVLVGVVPIVGLPCAVSAAPRLALALGYDIDDALEHQSGD
jgi:alkylhydroperoxidase/carboxymuconolactone decarboxylase family protein YurZ